MLSLFLNTLCTNFLIIDSPMFSSIVPSMALTISLYRGTWKDGDLRKTFSDHSQFILTELCNLPQIWWSRQPKAPAPLGRGAGSPSDNAACQTSRECFHLAATSTSFTVLTSSVGTSSVHALRKMKSKILMFVNVSFNLLSLSLKFSISHLRQNGCRPAKCRINYELRKTDRTVEVNYCIFNNYSPKRRWLVNNYSPKWRWLVASRLGKYPTLATDTEVNSFFSIY